MTNQKRLNIKYVTFISFVAALGGLLFGYDTAVISGTVVRGQAMSVATLSLWVGTYLIGQLTPWMLETLSPAGTFFLFALMCVPYMLIVWKLMPKTAGKSLEDIERFWLSKVKKLKIRDYEF